VVNFGRVKQSRTPLDWVYISDIGARDGDEVTVKGWL
jgi:hypothetical protein